jgi:hypothetical protein
VQAISCSTASLCTAVGVYTNWLGVYLPLVQVYNGSSWSPGQAANLTQMSPSVSLNGVSCLTPSSCTIVGGYANGGPGGSALVEVWNGSGWTVQRTPNPGQQHGSTLTSIWCGSAASCVAVGDYWDTNNFPQVFGIVWNGTQWTPLQVPNPSATRKGFLSVSCASMTACAAVGWQESNTTAYDVPLAETWNGSSWTIDSVPVPTGIGNADLTGVSCASATACTAVGYYGDSSGLQQILIEVWNGASWSLQNAPSPSGARSPSLSGVSCTSPTACTAVGGYGTSGAGQSLAEVWDGVSWSIQTTPNVGTLGTGLSGVSCAQAASCEAVGRYETSSTPTDAPVAEAWDGTSWSAQNVPVPTGALTSQLSQVSCGTPTTCMATGEYDAPHTGTITPLLERYS